MMNTNNEMKEIIIINLKLGWEKGFWEEKRKEERAAEDVGLDLAPAESLDATVRPAERNTDLAANAVAMAEQICLRDGGLGSLHTHREGFGDWVKYIFGPLLFIIC